MSIVRERYRAQPMAANASTGIGGGHIAGFLCTATGTLTVTDAGGTVLVNAVPVTAGIYTPIPISFGDEKGATVQLASNAAGTLMV